MFLIVPPKSVLYEKEITPLSGVLDLFFFFWGGGHNCEMAEVQCSWDQCHLGGFPLVMSAMGNKKH